MSRSMLISQALRSARQGYGNSLSKLYRHETVNYSAIPRNELFAQLANPTITRSAKRQIARQLGLAYAS